MQVRDPTNEETIAITGHARRKMHALTIDVEEKDENCRWISMNFASRQE